jgi:hypothetical protein
MTNQDDIQRQIAALEAQIAALKASAARSDFINVHEVANSTGVAIGGGALGAST